LCVGKHLGLERERELSVLFETKDVGSISVVLILLPYHIDGTFSSL